MSHGVPARTILTLAVAGGAVSLCILAANLSSAAPQPPAPASQATSVPDLLASPSLADVVDAADAFLATLTEEQRAIAQIGLKPELAVRWTNFPGDNRRNGIFFHQMKPGQAEAALKVARAALGEEGFSRFQEVRASDDGAAARLRAAGTAYGFVNGVHDLSRHKALRRVTVETERGPASIVAPPAIRDRRAPALGAVPAIGQHTAAIRQEFARTQATEQTA